MIGRFGSGTQMVEGELRERFPEATILRMDADTTKGKQGHEAILEAFADGKADILVGTQMIVKGHDFPNVTLVGVLAADLSLHSQDYMAGERTFDLLTQAAGRAGRGEKPGRVVIQSYDPEQVVIQTAASQDYEAFYENEIAYRRLLRYPPVCNMLAVLITSEQEAVVDLVAGRIAAYARTVSEEEVKSRVVDSEHPVDPVRVIGPATPVIAKVKDLYRRVLYLKSLDEEALLTVRAQIEAQVGIMQEQNQIRVYFDLNPMKGY